MIEWVVRETDPRCVGAIVALAGGDARAIADGRVFVGRRRAKDPAEDVRVGERVVISREAENVPPGVTILARESDLIVAAKPAGMPTIADHGGSAHTLLSAVASLGGVELAQLHPTSRLDRDVSGAVVLALSSAARRRLEAARAAGKYHRRYVAIAGHAPEPQAGEWTSSIGRARDPRHRAIAGRDATDALTRFATIARAGRAALLALAPVTGRTHQLRLHASHAGAALLGDRIYGAGERQTLPGGKVVALKRVALHAARITVPRADGTFLVVDAPVPLDLTDLWALLSGDPTAWRTAIEQPLP